MIWWSLALAQSIENEVVLPIPEGDIEQPRRGPDKKSYEGMETLQRLLQSELEGRKASESEVERLREQLRKTAQEQLEQQNLPPLPETETRLALPGVIGRPPSPQPSPSILSMEKGTGSTTGTRSRARPRVGDRVGSTPPPIVGGLQTFTVPEAAEETRNFILPAGSYVKTRILTGVEAGDAGLVPMTLQADYAARGPNGIRVDLTGCMVIAQVKGELSTDRVVGKAVTLSCVRDDGRVLDVDIDGYLAGEDSTLGIVGQLISRQGRVLAAATVANLAKGAGEAISVANSTTQVLANPLGGVAGQAQNVTGDQAAFVVGGSVAEAATDIADWYLQYAQKLTPAIAVGSGRDVWVVLLESVEFEGLR